MLLGMKGGAIGAVTANTAPMDNLNGLCYREFRN